MTTPDKKIDDKKIDDKKIDEQSFRYSIKPRWTAILLAWRTGRRFRERRRAGVAVFVNRLDREEIIVFREAFHHVFGHVPDVDAALPEGLVGLAPDDAVAGEVRLGVRLPRQSRVVFLTRRFETDARRRGGRQGHR